MPDAALKATEHQFLRLVASAADGIAVHVSLFALPGVARTGSGRQHVEQSYSPIENLWNCRLDGLIVTGTEPNRAHLVDEPYWQYLTNVIEWAEYNTYSTIWSCLAAHAAVQHIDGIGRRRLHARRFGVFECSRASSHELTAGLPSFFHVPHSRWNDVPEDALRDCGYTVLTQFKDGAVDTFVKHRRSLFVYFQGHPEYESNTLLLEFRRDLGRYLRRENDTYPQIPEGYFGQSVVDALATMRTRDPSSLNGDLFADMRTTLEQGLVNSWFSTAARVYANWLAYLSNQKQLRFKSRRCLKGHHEAAEAQQ